MAVPAQNNPPVHPEYFQPSLFDITNITQDIQATVTMSPMTINGVTVYPNYVVGQLIRILIPFTYGMSQINRQRAYVLSVPTSTSVVVDIDTRNYNAFISSPLYSHTPPQIVAVGDVNSGVVNASGRTNQGTYVLGSFINISPN